MKDFGKHIKCLAYESRFRRNSRRLKTVICWYLHKYKLLTLTHSMSLNYFLNINSVVGK